jgi:hypothetical protein
MPRKSAAASAVVITGQFGQRPDPPSTLTPRQADVWRAIVASEHSDFFSTEALRNLLVGYCRHWEAAENVSSVINSFPPGRIKRPEGAQRYHNLLRMRDLEMSAATRLATKLRITNQSRYQAPAASNAARSAAKGPKPWEM